MKKEYHVESFVLQHKRKLDDKELEALERRFSPCFDSPVTEDKEEGERWYGNEDTKPYYKWGKYCYPIVRLIESTLVNEETGDYDCEIIEESMISFQKDLELQELIKSYGDLDELTVEQLKELKAIVEEKSKECIEDFDCEIDLIEWVIDDKMNE